jgi:hypothetical protein
MTNGARRIDAWWAIGTNGVTNRVGSIYDTTENGMTIDRLTYLGSGTISKERFQQPNVGYDLLGTTGGHANLDLHGRIVDQVWKNFGNGSTLDG